MVLLIMVISSTVCEIYFKQLNKLHSGDSKNQLFTSFSIISNTRKLSQGDDRFDLLGCIKLLLTFHVVIVHTYLIYLTSPFAKRIFIEGFHKILIDKKYFFIRSGALTMDIYMIIS